MKTYSVQCRIANKTPWTTEDRYPTLALAEAAAELLRSREPRNEDGEALEYRVMEGS